MSKYQELLERSLSSTVTVWNKTDQEMVNDLCSIIQSLYRRLETAGVKTEEIYRSVEPEYSNPFQ